MEMSLDRLRNEEVHCLEVQWLSGKCDMKRRTFSRGAVNVNGPTVVIANPFYDSEPYAQTLALGCSAEETLIEKWQVKWLNANPRIRDRKTVPIKTDANEAPLGILHCVSEQIYESRMQRLRIERKNCLWLDCDLKV